MVREFTIWLIIILTLIILVVGLVVARVKSAKNVSSPPTPATTTELLPKNFPQNNY